jgi:hypothetical protein
VAWLTLNDLGFLGGSSCTREAAALRDAENAVRAGKPGADYAARHAQEMLNRCRFGVPAPKPTPEPGIAAKAAALAKKKKAEDEAAAKKAWAWATGKSTTEPTTKTTTKTTTKPTYEYEIAVKAPEPEEKTEIHKYEWQPRTRTRTSVLQPLTLPTGFQQTTDPRTGLPSLTVTGGPGMSATTIAAIAGGVLLFGGLIWLATRR